jgi:parallel beta-helix repeat protein
MIKRLLYILAILLIAGYAFGADVYIDPDWGGAQSGTFAEPWDSWTDVTGGTGFLAADDYRQKCGTETTATLTITTLGASDNHIIIGAYYDDSGAVHEDDSPSFGQLCGNSAQKPILKNTLGSGTIITTAEGGDQYLEVNSIQMQDAIQFVYVRSNYNIIRYCYLYNAYWGIRVGLNTGSWDGDYNMIEYNYIDTNVPSKGHEDYWDAISLASSRASYNTIQYNHITEYDHAGVQLTGSDNNLIQYNYIYGGDIAAESECFTHNTNADNNVHRFNFCQDAGAGHQIQGGNDNEIYGNVYTCNSADKPDAGTGCFVIQSNAGSSITSSNNKIYNNVIYDNDNNANTKGISIYAGAGDGGDVSGNDIYNNIIFKVDQYCIASYDDSPGEVIGTNNFYNNSCYDYGTNQYARVYNNSGDTAYQTASGTAAFNDAAFASGNIDTDPGMEDPASYEFWPASGSSNIVGAGYDLGSVYDDLLDPDTTDFTATPPEVDITPNQPAAWYIGAYEVSGAAPPAATKQLQGISLQGATIN